MGFNINEIRSQLTLGGARPTLFQIQFQNPANGAADIKVPFMAMAASIPPATTGMIQVPYFGRKFKIAGDRTFPEWQVAIINDEDFLIRNAMEEWSNRINTFQGNLRAFPSSSPLQYKTQARVTQYAKTGVPLRVYKFDGLFPLEVSPINLSWNNTDQIEEFTVTFAYDWWSIDSGVTGDAGGS